MIKTSYLVKGQRKFILVVKSQSKYLAGQHFDRGRRSEYRIYRSVTPLLCGFSPMKFCAEVLLRSLVHQCLFTENSRGTLKNREYCESFAQQVFPRLQYSIKSKQTRCIKKFEFKKGSRDRNKK